ncbi:MAG: hypothetical protein ACOY4Q_06475 [Bacillota bacterium]
MKKTVKLEDAIKKNQMRFIKTLPYLPNLRMPRTKPRSAEESTGLAMATAEVVQKAFKSGKLIKNPKGYILK